MREFQVDFTLHRSSSRSSHGFLQMIVSFNRTQEIRDIIQKLIMVPATFEIELHMFNTSRHASMKLLKSQPDSPGESCLCEALQEVPGKVRGKEIDSCRPLHCFLESDEPVHRIVWASSSISSAHTIILAHHRFVDDLPSPLCILL